MNLTSKEIIKSLNERLLMQSVVVETLCDLLVDNGVVTHEDLEDMIKENLESQHKQIQEMQIQSFYDMVIIQQLRAKNKQPFYHKKNDNPI